MECTRISHHCQRNLLLNLRLLNKKKIWENEDEFFLEELWASWKWETAVKSLHIWCQIKKEKRENGKKVIKAKWKERKKKKFKIFHSNTKALSWGSKAIHLYGGDSSSDMCCKTWSEPMKATLTPLTSSCEHSKEYFLHKECSKIYVFLARFMSHRFRICSSNCRRGWRQFRSSYTPSSWMIHVFFALKLIWFDSLFFALDFVMVQVIRRRTGRLWIASLWRFMNF